MINPVYQKLSAAMSLDATDIYNTQLLPYIEGDLSDDELTIDYEPILSSGYAYSEQLGKYIRAVLNLVYDEYTDLSYNLIVMEYYSVDPSIVQAIHQELPDYLPSRDSFIFESRDLEDLEGIDLYTIESIVCLKNMISLYLIGKKDHSKFNLIFDSTNMLNMEYDDEY